jgi:hypothetical protein
MLLRIYTDLLYWLWDESSEILDFLIKAFHSFHYAYSYMFFLFVCFVYRRTSSFSTIWWLSPLPVTGLQILAYTRHSGPLSREGSLSCHTYCDMGPRFIRSHPKDRHLRPTVGFESSTQGSSYYCARRSNHCATQATIWVGQSSALIFH